MPIYTVNCQFFALNLKKIYTGQKKFTRAPPVAPVTNMRYGKTKDMALARMKILKQDLRNQSLKDMMDMLDKDMVDKRW